MIQLVGAGPGDPELLTIKALRAIEAADVILHDRLVGPQILSLARPGATLVYVGKIGGGKSTPQASIEARMIAEAKAGRRVVRLKGGDPFIFGRGGEEMEAARAEGIPCEIIPGVSAAMGAAAAVQMPLTHRDHARTLIFATGHGQSGDNADGEPDLDWRALADPRATVVIYMGVATAALIAEKLIEAGRSANTPAIVVENATLPAQKVVHTHLESMSHDMTKARIIGPAVLLIGDAAGATVDYVKVLEAAGAA